MRKIIDKIDDKMQILITLFIVFFLCVTSATYVYFSLSSSSNFKNEKLITNMIVEVSDVLSMDNKKTSKKLFVSKTSKGNLSDFLSASLKNNCLDNNKNLVCHIYKVKVANVSDTVTQVIDGSIAFYADSKFSIDIKNKTSNLKWRLIENYDELDVLKTTLGENENNSASINKNFFAKNINLRKGSDIDYYLVVWLDGENMDVDSIDSYFIEIQISSSNGTNITSIFEG